MEINALSSDYRNLPENSVQNRTILADVVIIDQVDPAKPKVYLLRDEIAKELESGVSVDHLLLDRWKELFLDVGKARIINRTKRSIILENNNTVSCKHLIIATGDASVDQRQEAFRPGLHALASALRMRKERLLSIYEGQEQTSNHKCRAHLENGNKQETLSLLNIVSKTLNNSSSSGAISKTGHRFFEVIP